MEQQQKPKMSVSTSFNAVVDSIDDALSFVVSVMDEVGPSPTVHIHPGQPAPSFFGMPVPEMQDMTGKFIVQVDGVMEKDRAGGMPQ